MDISEILDLWEHLSFIAVVVVFKKFIELFLEFFVVIKKYTELHKQKLIRQEK